MNAILPGIALGVFLWALAIAYVAAHPEWLLVLLAIFIWFAIELSIIGREDARG